PAGAGPLWPTGNSRSGRGRGRRTDRGARAAGRLRPGASRHAFGRRLSRGGLGPPNPDHRHLDLYVSRPVAPNIVVRSGFYYEASQVVMVYIRADVDNETSHGFGVAPFVAISHPLSDRASLEFRPTLAFRKSDFAYDLNVPSSASISSTTLSLPATLSYELTPELTVSGTAGINQV